jgi:hypothetical protein
VSEGVRKLDIRSLSESARLRYMAEWTAIQEQFADSPQAAVADAYALVTDVMKERGYPVADARRRALERHAQLGERSGQVSFELAAERRGRT